MSDILDDIIILRDFLDYKLGKLPIKYEPCPKEALDRVFNNLAIKSEEL